MPAQLARGTTAPSRATATPRSGTPCSAMSAATVVPAGTSRLSSFNHTVVIAYPSLPAPA